MLLLLRYIRVASAHTPSMSLSDPASPSSPRHLTYALNTVATTLLSPKLSASHFAAYHAYHRDLCRHAATLPRQLSDHLTHLHTLRSTSRTFSSHLARLSHPPPSATSSSVLRHFTGVTELLRVAVVQQLDTALARLVECVGSLGSSAESMARLCDSLRTSAMTVDVQLLTVDVAAVRLWESVAAAEAVSDGSGAKRTPGSGRGSASGGSHRKQRPNGKQHANKQQAEEADVDASLTAPVSPYTLLLTLEDIVYALTSLHQQHAAVLAKLQAALTGGEEKPEVVMREALEVLSDTGAVNSSIVEEWSAIIRRACKP